MFASGIAMTIYPAIEAVILNDAKGITLEQIKEIYRNWAATQDPRSLPEGQYAYESYISPFDMVLESLSGENFGMFKFLKYDFQSRRYILHPEYVRSKELRALGYRPNYQQLETVTCTRCETALLANNIDLHDQQCSKEVKPVEDET